MIDDEEILFDWMGYWCFCCVVIVCVGVVVVDVCVGVVVVVDVCVGVVVVVDVSGVSKF